MKCTACGHELVEGAVFCQYCGEKVSGKAPVDGRPVYEADVKGLLKSGRLTVYRDRTEFLTSSVQKSVFHYSALVAVKKGLDRILFITEDGRTESCMVSRKIIHEAFLYIEQVARPYIEERKNRLLSMGIQYSFASSQGLTSGVLNISTDRAEFKAKTGQADVVPFQEVRSAHISGGNLEFSLTDGRTKAFAVSRDMQEEVLAFVERAAEPYITERREALLAQGIYHSFPTSYGPDTGVLNIFRDRAEYTAKSGPGETVLFQDIRAVRLYMGTLELGLTDGSFKSFTADRETGDEVLPFIEDAIQSYVTRRTAGFDTSFGVDERIELNEERGVFHIIRQGGNEITDEFPLEALVKCEWVECRVPDGMLGGVLSGGMAILNSAAKAAGAQGAAKAEDLIRYIDIFLTLRTEGDSRAETVRFGSFPLGLSRTNKKYGRYLGEAAALMDCLRTLCPDCELIEPAPPEPEAAPQETAGSARGTRDLAPVSSPAGTEEISAVSAAAESDQFGITKYIEGVSEFIGECTTPMTIAIQGSWGSGKNSIMNLISHRLEGTYGENLIWFHTWQFSQFDLGDQLPMLVANKLTGQLNGAGGVAAKDRAVKVAKGLISITSGFISQGSSDGQNLTEAIFRDSSADSLEKRVRTFSELVKKRTEGTDGKAVILIDDLDRLSPAKSAEMLEALRNFFDCEGCVFVCAVDYNSVIRGAMERNGEAFDENKGKRFFDNLFQVSFRVPVSGFNIQNYVKGKLERLEIDAGGETELEFYAELIKRSVGGDPKSIDHLFNSFLLLKKLSGGELYQSKDKRLMLFSLLCMQSKFHDVYDLIVRMKDKITPKFLSELCTSQSEVLVHSQLSDDEKAEFCGFAQVFCAIINTDRKEDISEQECREFGEVLDFSSITSK